MTVLASLRTHLKRSDVGLREGHPKSLSTSIPGASYQNVEAYHSKQRIHGIEALHELVKDLVECGDVVLRVQSLMR